MGTKKTPMRMCTGCREMKPKKELVRIVKTTDEQILVDLTGKINGRGAYICKNCECLEKAKKTGAISRAFETSIPDEIYNRIERSLEKIEE